MADKRLAYDTRGKDDMFADDDPLAELARIVGFEPRIAANTVDEPQRQEPVLNLEDELLREFESYDAPRPLAASDHQVGPVAQQQVEADDYVEPVQEDVPSIGEELVATVVSDFEAPVVEPEFPEATAVAPEVAAPEPVAVNREAPGADDWAPVPTKPVAVSADPPSTFTTYGGARDLIEELELSIGGALPAAPSIQPPAKAPQWSAASIRLPIANFHAPRREEPVLTELAIEAPVVEPAPVEAFAAEPEFVAEPVSTVEPEVAVPDVAEEPLPVAAVEAADFEPVTASFGFPAEIDRHEDVALPEEPVASFEDIAAFEEPVEPANSGFDLIAAAAEGDVHPDAALTEALPEPAFDAETFDLDDLLADVSRYPVPQRAASSVASEPVAAAPEPVVASPVPQPAPVPAVPVFEAPVFEAPVFDTPLFAAPVARASVQPTVIAPVPMSRATPVLRQPEAPKPVVRAPVEPVSQPIAPAPGVARQPELEAEDPFAGHDFELDLAGIELELADLDFAEPQSKPEPEPVRVAPVITAQPAPRPQPAPVFVPEPQPAPVSYAKPAPASESTDDLPFDPSMISDPEDRPETVEDMHVPTLPPVEHPEPVAKTADFDFDLDAEIASFFEPAKRQEKAPVAPAWASPVTAATATAVAKPANSVFADGLDDFERALEEDFRRSVREPVERRENVSEVHIESASQTADFNRARSMRRLLAAAAMLVVFAGGAYGVYTWVSNGPGLGIVSSGEPRVITADKDPVKVVPENPGGKTVPNQDKAVYDRVAGAAEEPKQKALVSSDEAPVDVVQRTLTPEVSPDDNEGSADQVMPTAVGETQDPRLLPDHDNTVNASASDDDAVPSVSPRKVRTMIVKPDGTLVAREELAPVEQSAPANDVAAATPATQPAATPSAASFPASTGNQVASAAIPPVGTAPAAQATAKVAEVNAANPNQVDPPVRAVKTTPIADAASAVATDTAPVPTARPAEQPVNVVGTVTENGNIRPTAQQKSTQVASAPAAAAAQPAQQAPAAASGGYGIQIASLPSEDEAKKSYASLSKKFAGVLGGRAYEIRKADIAGKGTFYRVRIPAGSKDEAAALCEQYRSAGGSCLISR
ncbi:SPOR domain-containing protein [Rhizobium sp. WYJ-E13]|uniref:SPOR domain-containing protein n=1 Tax=Rhizobium sp. WYJ-E13 TaxID=2849093 RepID=UPI001C1ED431|nr:SPOR domain-containing protein [Rhizobium sp. WYJ-E13]QWW69275.1 SPOR domain-containing protein [Rhizobium sp. WYJ-E13]